MSISSLRTITAILITLHVAMASAASGSSGGKGGSGTGGTKSGSVITPSITDGPKTGTSSGSVTTPSITDAPKTGTSTLDVDPRQDSNVTSPNQIDKNAKKGVCDSVTDGHCNASTPLNKSTINSK